MYFDSFFRKCVNRRNVNILYWIWRSLMLLHLPFLFLIKIFLEGVPNAIKQLKYIPRDFIDSRDVFRRWVKKNESK
jgi:hypothetical protein